MITRSLGLDAVGLYTAALSLSTVFVQFILSAMGNDFYPRLTTHASDHRTMCQLINEQTEIGMLLAFPCLVATFVFSPQIIALFYADDFMPAVTVLRWLILGNIGRVISWPMGFSILAKRQTFLFVGLETAFHSLNILLTYIGLVYGGLNGVAISFAVLYLAYTLSLVFICKFTIGFAWSRHVVIQLVWMLPATTVVYALGAFSDAKLFFVVGLLLTLLCILLCLGMIIRRANLETNASVRKMLALVQRSLRIHSNRTSQSSQTHD